MKTLKKITITKDDFFMVNVMRNGITSFAIRILDEKIFNDDMAENLESFINDKGIFADIFNVEYMGFLTGQVKIDNIEDILPFVNEFLKK